MSIVGSISSTLTSSSPSKATLTCKECKALSFDELPFNPSSLSLTRNVTWTQGGEALAPYGSLSYAKGNPDSLNLAVLLDESEFRPTGYYAQVLQNLSSLPGSELALSMEKLFGWYNENSVTIDMARLYALTMPIAATDGNAGGTMRPPVVLFHYGDFAFHGVVASYSATMQLFDEDGSPRRAEVNLGLQGRAFQPFAYQEMFDAAYAPEKSAEDVSSLSLSDVAAMALEPRRDALAQALK